jgi:hypothetical protein
VPHVAQRCDAAASFSDIDDGDDDNDEDDSDAGDASNIGQNVAGLSNAHKVGSLSPTVFENTNKNVNHRDLESSRLPKPRMARTSGVEPCVSRCSSTPSS